MPLAERFRALLLRWDRVALTLVLAAPVLASSVLGFIWLHERGWLLIFALVSAGFYAVVRLGVALARRRRAAEGVRTLASPTPDPDWSEAETAVYARARARINERLRAPIPWADLPAEALGVVEEVATSLSGGQRSALDFTLPEALLLIDRVALRYRAFLLTHVPWSDRLSVRTMHWLWRHQDTALTAWETGFLAWRGVRLVLNPAVALLREAERVLATGLQDRLTDGFRRDAQAILLEEAAMAAVDLYSGRLKLSAAEVAALDSRSLPALAQDLPVRIVLVGQSGVGKSALVNALAGRDAVETETRGATGTAQAVAMGVGAVLVDTAGLDGTSVRLRAALAQMEQADLILWLHRAQRPGRAPDAELAAAWATRLAQDPARRWPSVLHVATGADLSPATSQAVTLALGQALGPATVLAASVTATGQGLPAVRAAIDLALTEARQVQRARLRRVTAPDTGLGANLLRGARGARAAAGRLFRRG